MAPKILFSKSESVNKLISSGVSNYLEFNNVSENYFYNPDLNNNIDKLKTNELNDEC
jgi:RAB protein geranylgeranyltransferase component A